MPAWLAPLAIGAGSSALEALLGEGDRWEMSPEQRKLYEALMKEYQTGSFGYSTAEKMNMAKELRGGLDEQTQRAIGSTQGSLSRRGMLSPGQMGGMATDITASAGKAYGEGLTDIELASVSEGRRRKAELESALMGTSQGQFIPADDSIFDDIGGMAGDWMYYELMKDRKKKRGSPYGDYNYGDGDYT